VYLPVEGKLGDSNGHWLAYSSEVTGRMEVYVRPFPANVSGNETAVPTPLTLVLNWTAGLK